jgi:hypothetical protein
LALNRNRIRRLEDSGFLLDKLELPDGRQIECAKGKKMKALLAAIKGEEHRLHEYYRQINEHIEATTEPNSNGAYLYPNATCAFLAGADRYEAEHGVSVWDDPDG